ncbi:MAG: C25 family cysteine peptidase [Saprospiraceae bacterium]
MIKKLYQVIFLLFTVHFSFAQMTDNGQTRYGNEWIVDGQLYYKIKITEDGAYKIDQPTLKNAGFTGDIIGSDLQLFKNGAEVPVTVSSNGTWSASDFLIFNGYYNKSEIDKYSFPNGTNDIVNPKASMYSDTAVYFLTINNSNSNSRTKNLPNILNNLPAAETSIDRISELNLKELCNTKTEYAGTHSYVNTPFSSGKGMVAGAYNQTYSLDCPGLINTSRLPVFSLRGVTSPGNVTLNIGHDLKFYMQDKLMYNAYAQYENVLYVNFSYLDTFRVIKPLDNRYTLTNGHPLDQIRVGYLSIQYPAALIVENDQPLKFHLEANDQDRYLEFEYSGINPTAPYLTDSIGSFNLTGVVEGSKIKFKLPASNSSLPLILFTNNNYKAVNSISSVVLKSFKNFNPQYVILSHTLLMNGPAGSSAADQYANYRRSPEGGGYNVALVNVSDVYNSFCYGLDYNPMSVKNFANYLGLSGNTKFMFILGRGRDYKDIRSDSDLKTAISKGYGVPSFGDYGSDNLLVSKSFDKLDLNQAIGRLPAVTQDEVIVYLNKIKTSDAAYNAPGDNESKQWTKQIVQLNGGNVGGPDQAGIADGQKEAQDIIETSKLSGFVTTFVKGSNETIGKASEDYFKLVNQGVSIVDYFGHGALASLEYPIDIPSKYSNSPRLPILIIKGCKTGNCQRDGSSIPAKFLYEDSYRNTGFRAVIGSISDSDLNTLSALARRFYTLLGGTLYGKTLGEVFQNTFNTPGLNQSGESIQQLYVGDPALSIAPFLGPDFTIAPNSVKTNPEVITTIENKFEVSFDIINLGTNYSDTLFYTATYENPAKKIIKSTKQFILNPRSTGRYKFDFELDKTNSSGESTIYITLDPDNKIAESVAPQAELNNEYKNSLGTKGFKFFIKTSAIEAVYPYRYSIVDTNKVTISAYSQSLNLLPKNYTFYLDTTDLFNSPILETKVISSIAGHLEWSPNSTLLEEKVYYWKVTKDSLSPSEPFNIATSSFTYLKGKTGFSQSHNGQYREDSPQNLSIVGGGNNPQFGKRTMNFTYKNGYPKIMVEPLLLGTNREGVNIGAGRPYLSYGQSTEGLLGTLWYKKDSMFVAYPINTNPYGALPAASNINNRNYLVFESSTEEGRKSIVNFIENVAGPEDIIVFFTYLNKPNDDLSLSKWAADSISNNGKNIFNVIEKYGGTKIRNLLTTGPAPYTIAFDKSKGKIQEELALDTLPIDIIVNTLCHADGGKLFKVFGTSGLWDSFEMIPKDSVGRKDTINLKLTAIHKFNADSNYVISSIVTLNQDPILIDLKEVDANRFPSISMDLSIRDPFLYRGKMDQFEYVRFISKELPEATLLNNSVSFQTDTINQGSQGIFKIRSKNIGKLPMDSMLVKFTLRGNSQGTNEEFIRFEKLPKGSSSEYPFKFETKKLTGNYDFICEMNPTEDQPEAFHGNNIYSRKLFVQGDNQNPLVDATFDGARIFNGDIISSKPLIKITIRDENKLFPLDDPALFNLNLVNAFGQDTLIPLTSAEIKFFPADIAKIGKKNEAIIEYKPDFAVYPSSFNGDGEYSIRITAKDVAGNQSGKYDFEKRFRIINKKSVSNVFNYPNPFSNATRFVFTLTGFELPTYYKLQIMSVSGKIVKEISQNELGPLKIGKHMTDYVWNGTDEYGDKLANGVYLYRMIMKDQEKKNYEKLEDGRNIDEFFDGQWGKLVIIR